MSDSLFVKEEEKISLKRILFVVGTRPEVIKVFPLIHRFKQSQNFEVLLCNTAQQRDLSDQFLSLFDLKSDFDLNCMSPSQSLPALQSKILSLLPKCFENENFDGVLAQGDTMSVFCAALCAFYQKIPFFHLEAGMRTFDYSHPYPEEMFRVLITRLTSFHFVATDLEKNNLLAEGVCQNSISVTGNTVVDALQWVDQKNEIQVKEQVAQAFPNVDWSASLVLVTVHRRENHGSRLGQILEAIKKLHQSHCEFQFLIPVHPNPNVKACFQKELAGLARVHLTSSLDYPVLISLIKKAHLILTDSGGIQEESPSFGTPTLVLRDKTERQPAIDCGVSQLTGVETLNIVQAASKLLSQSFEKSRCSVDQNPFGDGKASERVLQLVMNYFSSCTEIKKTNFIFNSIDP